MRCGGIRGVADVFDEDRLGIVTLPLGDNSRHDVDHGNVQRAGVVQGLLEVTIEVRPPPGHSGHAAFGARGIAERRVEQDHANTRVAKAMPYFPGALVVGKKVLHGLEAHGPSSGETLANR